MIESLMDDRVAHESLGVAPMDTYTRAFLYLSYVCSTCYSNQQIDLILVIEQSLPYFTKPD